MQFKLKSDTNWGSLTPKYQSDGDLQYKKKVISEMTKNNPNKNFRIIQVLATGDGNYEKVIFWK